MNAVGLLEVKQSQVLKSSPLGQVYTELAGGENGSTFQLFIQQFMMNEETPIEWTQSEMMPLDMSEAELDQLLSSEEWTNSDFIVMEQLLRHLKQSIGSRSIQPEALQWVEQHKESLTHLVQRLSNLSNLWNEKSNEAIFTKHDFISGERVASFQKDLKAILSVLLEQTPANDSQKSTVTATKLENVIQQLSNVLHNMGEKNVDHRYEMKTLEQPVRVKNAAAFKFDHVIHDQPTSKYLTNRLFVPYEGDSVRLQANKYATENVSMIQHEEQPASLKQVVLAEDAGRPSASILQSDIKDAHFVPKTSSDTKTPTAPTVPQSSIQDLPETMSRVMLKKFETLIQNGTAEAKIRLVPEQLGTLDVHLKMQQGNLVAEFRVDRVASKEMIEGQLAMLRTALQSHGIQVDRLEVTTGSHMQQQSFTQEHHRQQTFSKQAFQSRTNQDAEWSEEYWDYSDHVQGVHGSRPLGHTSAIDIMA